MILDEIRTERIRAINTRRVFEYAKTAGWIIRSVLIKKWLAHTE